MKKNIILKILVSFAILVTSMLITTVCNAASISISAGSSSLTVGSTTTITIRGNDIAGKINISSSNPNVIAISKTTEWLEGTVTLKATAKSAGTAKITVTSVDTASLSTGEAVSASAGMNISSKAIVIDTRSKNNNLSSLLIEGGWIAPVFNSETTHYTSTVSFDVDSLNISAIPSDNKATTAISGNMDLVTGENIVSVVVTAENGSKKTYTIVVTKEKNPDDLDAHLKNITINNAVLRDVFDSEKYEYICEDIYADIEKLDILAETKIEGATTEILGNENLEIGTNVITIKVTSKDGSASKEYKILVYKLNEVLALKNVEEASFRSINGIINMIRQNIVESVLILVIFILVIFNIILFLRKTKYKKIVKKQINTDEKCEREEPEKSNEDDLVDN